MCVCVCVCVCTRAWLYVYMYEPIVKLVPVILMCVYALPSPATYIHIYIVPYSQREVVIRRDRPWA